MSVLTQFVQTGVTTYEELKEKDQQPTYSFKDLNVAISELEKMPKNKKRGGMTWLKF